MTIVVASKILKRMKAANKLSFSRIIIAPIFFMLYFMPQWIGNINSELVNTLNIISVCIMVPLVLFAEFTDYLDGYVARKNNEISDFGKLFDPFCDVILHLVLFISYMLSGYLPPIIFVFIFIREYAILFIRLMAMKKGVAIGARKGGKLKTVVYIVSGMYSLFLESSLRIGITANWNMSVLKNVGVGLYVLCLILCYVSFFDYLRSFGKVLKDEI